jgi:hypothetical protein
MTAKEALKTALAANEEKKKSAMRIMNTMLPKIYEAIKCSAGGGYFTYRETAPMDSFVKDAVYSELRVQGFGVEKEQDGSLIVSWGNIDSE